MTDVICGRGRLGQRIAAAMTAAGRTPLSLRIDPQQGLVASTGALPTAIDCLLICLVPRHPDGGSGWLGLLDGLCAQVRRGDLHIKRALLVSSTAVYASHATGWVDAATPVTPESPRSAGLIEAEQRTRELAPETVVARLAGITGPGYERYDPVTMSMSQPRHAIDVRAAASILATLAMMPSPAPACALITDGAIYWQGRALPASAEQPELMALSQQHRLMRPSHTGRP
ncbi:MAG TPA: hypothetical protein VFV64_12385 [Permianibacter sp.]|nr:hypothetical protein [Permianibacter sp.]